MVAWPGPDPEELARASTGVGKEVEHNNELIKVQPQARRYSRICSRSVKDSMEGSRRWTQYYLWLDLKQ